MAIINKGTSFANGEQLTADKINDLIDLATFNQNATDSQTTDVNSAGQIVVNQGGIDTAQLATSDSTTTGVTFAKMQHADANTVLVRDANSAGDISAKPVVDKQILIGNGNGFTPAILSGDVTMTNAGAVTIANDVALGGNPTTTTQSAGNNTTRVATTAFVTTAVANGTTATTNTAIIKSADAGARSSSTYYFNNMSESFDPDSIVSFSSGDITFASTGTYFIDISGAFIDGDLSSGDSYELQLTASTSSTTGLLQQRIPYAGNLYQPISIKYIRTVSNTSTDKLAVYAQPIDGASSSLWQASDVYIHITKLT